MAHAQKPDFVFRRNGRVHLNRPGGVSSVFYWQPTGSQGVRIIGSNAGYTMFRGSVKGTGHLLHSPVFPSLPFLCVTVYHHISTELYHIDPFFCVTKVYNVHFQGLNTLDFSFIDTRVPVPVAARSKAWV